MLGRIPKAQWYWNFYAVCEVLSSYWWVAGSTHYTPLDLLSGDSRMNNYDRWDVGKKANQTADAIDLRAYDERYGRQWIHNNFAISGGLDLNRVSYPMFVDGYTSWRKMSEKGDKIYSFYCRRSLMISTGSGPADAEDGRPYRWGDSDSNSSRVVPWSGFVQCKPRFLCKNLGFALERRNHSSSSKVPFILPCGSKGISSLEIEVHRYEYLGLIYQ